MASGADASTEESDASSSSHPTPRTIDGSKDSLDRPADSARSVGGAHGKKVLVLPKQAMPAALGPRQTSEADMGDGDVPMPWWYTPRRLLVSNLSPINYTSQRKPALQSFSYAIPRKSSGACNMQGRLTQRKG